MMRAVIYKDLRQQWPWLVGVSLLAIVYGVVSMMRWPATVDWWSTLLPFGFGNYYNIDPTPPLMRLQGIFILASAYGVVLGLLQGLSDTRGTSDFFLHRPCSRTRLAIAKLLGGSLLFWVPGIGAVALMTVWAGFGRFASPFRAWMALVPLLSWWIGYGFYLAATNVAWRPGRWFGPRLLPLVAPIPVAVFVLALPSLAQVLLALVLLTITYWLVNLHVLTCREHSAVMWNRGWDSAARGLTAVTLLVGLLAVIIFVGTIVANLFPREWDYRSVVFTEEGEPRIQTYEVDDSGMPVYEWFDLNGKSVGQFNYKDLASLSMASITEASPLGTWTNRYFTRLLGYGRDIRRHQVFWYFMANDGVVVGYAHPTGAFVGSFGPEGRVEDGASVGFVSARQVQATQWQTGSQMGYTFDHLFVDGDALFAFTLNPPQMSKLYQSDTGQIDRVGLASHLAEREAMATIFTVSDRRMTVLDPDGSEMGTVDLPVPLSNRRGIFLSAGWTGRKIVVLKWQSVNRRLAYAFSPTGEILNEWDFTIREPQIFVWWKSREHLPFNLCSAPWFGVLALSVDQFAEPVLALKSYWPLLLVSAAITCASVILTRRHLKHRRSRAILIWWLVVVALLSWPGYLLCLITARLPKRVSCPACGGPRPTETATCPQCRADWPLPKHTGLEILLPAHP